MKIVFFGSPETAVPFLRAVAREHEVAAVVTQPDKPAGRGLEQKAPAVKTAALELGLKVLQPAQPSSLAAEIKAWGADIGVVVAYGRLLKRDVLDAPRLGLLNVHFSLLPRYRGAAPVQWALARGEAKTGVSVFWLDEGMDTGPVQAMQETAIGPDEDAGALLGRLTTLGVDVLKTALSDIAEGKIVRREQAGQASLAPKIKREDGKIDFGMTALEMHNRVRGMAIWPKAFIETEKAGRVMILKTALNEDFINGSAFNQRPGCVINVERKHGILLQCSVGSLWFVTVQPEGKKPVPAVDFLNGLRLRVGDSLLAR